VLYCHLLAVEFGVAHLTNIKAMSKDIKIMWSNILFEMQVIQRIMYMGPNFLTIRMRTINKVTGCFC